MLANLSAGVTYMKRKDSVAAVSAPGALRLVVAMLALGGLVHSSAAAPAAATSAATDSAAVTPAAASASEATSATAPTTSGSSDVPPALAHLDDFITENCSACHNDTDKAGRLDLDSLGYNAKDPATFLNWVKVHDRLAADEMPPKKRHRPDRAEEETAIKNLDAWLTKIEQERTAVEGRSTLRRLNRYEYENTLRDLFNLPLLDIKDQLPEDGEAFRFNKVGDQLDVSHVQMSRFMKAADHAIREAVSLQWFHPATSVRRYYARDQKAITDKFTQSFFDPYPDRGTTPLVGTKAEPEVHAGRAPFSVGASDPAKREQEAVGWVHSYYVGAFNPYWDQFLAPVTGRYKVRFSGYTIWASPGGYRRDFTKGENDKVGIPMAPRWFLPNLDDVSAGRREEPITVYSRGAVMRRLGKFDLHVEPSVTELDDIWLMRNESLLTDAARFFRSRPTPKDGQFTNPLAQPDGQPGVAFRWIEVEGPIYDADSLAGYRLLFGDLPLREVKAGAPGVTVDMGAMQSVLRNEEQAPEILHATLDVVSQNPNADAERLLRSFMNRAYRRPVPEEDVQHILKLIHAQMAQGRGFGGAMVAGYTAVLCSPSFVFVEEKPGRLDDYALATRLALFLTNSAPDEALRAHAARGDLHEPAVLKSETQRLLDDKKSDRFVNAFLDYWLDLRKVGDSDPSSTLYPDYYLDESLVEAAIDETHLYFQELIRDNLPARDLITSDFTYVNERLAQHYGIPGVSGVAMRRTQLPADSVRGGIITQASVLKVTANGTTTSPVIRGHFITERILGIETPLPPPVPAVTPDIRGAVTIREQLAKHRADASCASCHSKMDPPGFALESFDVMGGWRDRYRGASDEGLPAIGLGHNGFPFVFHYALPVDSTGELPDGRKFEDVRELKRLLLTNESQVARNLIQQLMVYATAAPVRYSDRATVDRILEDTRTSGHGVRSMIEAIVQSDLFLNK